MERQLNYVELYIKSKDKLLNNDAICKSNRELFDKFFEEEEKKLKRIRNLREIDNSNGKTLYFYVHMFKSANKLFKNKNWKNLTKEDICKVYDDIEDGKLLNRFGRPFKTLGTSLYGKVFKSRPFELAGKKEIAKEVMKYTSSNKNDEVRFVDEENFKKMVGNVNKSSHKLLFWLAFDIGENINTLLLLKKSDFLLQKNPYTKETEYRVNFRKEILKRSRKPRSEITNYNETVELLNQILNTKKDIDFVFDLNYQAVKKIIRRLGEKTDIKCQPNGQNVTWKDLRSGMACDLLTKGWTTDEVNARLGHKPSSVEIDKYVNYLAIDRHRPKKKVHQFQMEKLNEELEEMKRNEKLQLQRNESLKSEFETFKQEIFNKFKEEAKDRIKTNVGLARTS